MPIWLPIWLLGAWLLPAVPVWSQQEGAQAEAAVQVVDRLQDALIAVMKDAKKLGYHGRYQQLAPVAKDTHDLRDIARVAVGAFWSKLSEAQKAQFVDTFTDLSIATYAYQFDDYSGEKFQTGAHEVMPRGDVMVHSTLTKSDGGQVRFDYILRQVDGRWRIVNIIADGVSDLALKRAEYSNVLKTEGFEALTAKLKSKIDEYAKKAA